MVVLVVVLRLADHVTYEANKQGNTPERQLRDKGAFSLTEPEYSPCSGSDSDHCM